MSYHFNVPGVQQLTEAATVLERILRFDKPADALLSAHFRNNRQIGGGDRAFIAEICYGVLRRLDWLRSIAGEQASARTLILLFLVRCGGLSINRLEPVLSADEKLMLSEAKARRPAETDLAALHDLPLWLVERLQARLGEAETLALARGLNAPAPLDIRINRLKTDVASMREAFAEAGIIVTDGFWLDNALRIEGKPAINRMEAFSDGWFEVQDQGSQLLSVLLGVKRGNMVVDFCAGAGGKTLQLGELMRNTGRLYAFDISERRLARLKPRMARSGLSNVYPQLISNENDQKLKRLAGKIDAVLVDAPCSGLGTLRRNPDLKWRQSPQSVVGLMLEQNNILRAASKLLRPGGRLVYATCSLLAEENQQIVEEFLAQNQPFVLRPVHELEGVDGFQKLLENQQYLQLFPHRHKVDGFFAAVIERAAV